LDFSSFHFKIIPAILAVVVISAITFSLVRFKIFNKIYLKLKKLKSDFVDGVMAISHLRNKVRYIAYTLLIFLFWMLMLFAVFFAYPPTNKLSFIVAVLTFAFGNLAYLLPIQAGIGAWHFIVINCLFFYGIDKESGMIFALIAHTFTNLIFLVFGPIALAFLPLINNTASKKLEIIPDHSN
jgi:hypothetical protein